MTKIIALCGHAGAGKSTLAEALYRHHHYTRTSFATPLKRMLSQLIIYQHAPAINFNDPKAKSIPSPWLNNQTPRHALQTLGTEWGRDLMGKDFWVNIWEHRINQLTRAVVDDLRFFSEAERVRKLGGFVIRIDRDGAEGITSTHISETELKTITPDFTISNNNSNHPEQMMIDLEYIMGDKL